MEERGERKGKRENRKEERGNRRQEREYRKEEIEKRKEIRSPRSGGGNHEMDMIKMFKAGVLENCRRSRFFRGVLKQ